MKVWEHVYTDIPLHRDYRKKLHNIKHRKMDNHLFVAALPLGNSGMLEVYDYRELLQPYYERMDADIQIVAISDTRGGALELVRVMLEHSLEKTGSLDICAYMNRDTWED